mgnify:FL=1
MKVYIGPYKSWFGPYQLAEKVLFWLDSQDDRVISLGEFFAHGFQKKPEDNPEIRRFMQKDERKNTWLYNVMLWADKYRKRTIDVKIHKYDTWSMDHTLAEIILPMLKQLKATKHGAPQVDLEDVPEHLHGTTTEDYDEQLTFDFYQEDKKDSVDFMEARWDWVLDEMIFAFGHMCDESWEEEYHSGEHDIIWVKEEKQINNPMTGKMEDCYRMEKGPNDTYKADYEGMKKVHDRMNNGFRLFGKYYRSLWD